MSKHNVPEWKDIRSWASERLDQALKNCASESFDIARVPMERRTVSILRELLELENRE